MLMFGWEFPPHNSGGLGTACFGLTKALAASKARVTFVLPRGEAVEADFGSIVSANIPSLKIKAVPGLIYPYVTEESYALARQLSGSHIYGWNLLEEVLMYAARSKKIVEDADFEIIHAHDWLSFPAGLMAKEVSGKPLIVHVHATEFDRTGGMGVNGAVYEIEKRGMEQADGVIAVSQWTKDVIVQYYGIPEEKIEVVHNGVLAVKDGKIAERLTELKKAGNQIVLSLGRITLQKGVDYFVQAAKVVLEHCPKTYFVIAGSGDMERKIIEMTAALGISDRVIFTGFLRGEELASLYQSADVYVMPSVSEPFGIAPLEALMHGAPVIISKQSGVSEVLKHALKVDFWDVDEMANKIIAVLRNPSLKDALRANGKKEAKTATWTKAAKKVMGYYKRFARS